MKKKVIIVVVIIVLMILLVPIPFKLRDGGTVEWKSLTYSIANVHSIYAVGNESNKYELGYKEGIVIKIFNMTVYNNTKYSLKEEFAIITVKNLTVTTLKKKFIEMMNIFIIYLVRKVSI